MTNLEIGLSFAEVITFAALVRLYRKQMIVRHLCIRFSDWCARKIDEMKLRCQFTEYTKFVGLMESR